MERQRINYMQEQIKSTPIYFVALILVIGALNQREHNELVREQIDQIHEAQLMQIKEGRKFEERMVERTNDLSLRIAQLEVSNEMWDMPIYKDPQNGKTYIEPRSRKN